MLGSGLVLLHSYNVRTKIKDIFSLHFLIICRVQQKKRPDRIFDGITLVTFTEVQLMSAPIFQHKVCWILRAMKAPQSIIWLILKYIKHNTTGARPRIHRTSGA